MKDCITWDLGELSRKSGKTELEIAKALFNALVIKAEVDKTPLRIVVAHKEKDDESHNGN